MSESITQSKQISELQAVSNLGDNDAFVVNTYGDSSDVAYNLTKQISFAKLADALYSKIISKFAANYQLSGECAYLDISSTGPNSIRLLDRLMQYGLNDTAYDSLDYHHAADGNYSLALSSEKDLGLNELAHLAYADLGLDQYVKKAEANATISCQPGQYINSLVQSNGKITGYTYGEAKLDIPVDETLDSSSSNPVQNAAIKNALDEKMNKSDGNMKVIPSAGSYIAGFSQIDGKITNVTRYKISSQQVDAALNSSSTNPVQNKAISMKLNELEAKINSRCDTTFLPLEDANSYAVAPNGSYVTGVTQLNGKISIQSKPLPTVTIDSEIDASSANPVENRAIAAKLNDIQAGAASIDLSKYVTKAYATVSYEAGNNKCITGIKQTDGRITDITTVSLPQATTNDTQSLKHSDCKRIINLNGCLFGAQHNIGTNVFVAQSDCLVTVYASIQIDYHICSFKQPRKVCFNGFEVKRIENAATPCYCTLLMKKGDTITITGGCTQTHGTTWSVNGAYLT